MKAETKKSMKKGIAAALAVAFSSGLVFEAYAITASDNTKGLATLKVFQRIKITKIRDLRFGDVLQGETSTLPVAANDNDKSAKFDVVGVPSTAVSVTLDKNSVDLVKLDANNAPIGSPTNDQKITISALQPSGDAPTNASGLLSIYVGGVRPAIPATQEAGNYSGEFTVTVTQSN